MGRFVPGAELARSFYREAVSPLVGDVPHSAALLGYGSDVLGYDDERSTDHGWGPRLQLFVEPDAATPLAARLERRLPAEFRGWPVRYGWDEVPVSHHVEVAELGDWLERRLGFDPRRGISTVDWLTTPQQLLLEVTRGAVFHDGLDELDGVRVALAWYPDDVWLWLLACQWRRLDQEEPFVGRAAQVGDDLGSRLVAAHLVRDAMRLAHLLERRYAPYSEWLGTAFRELSVAAALGPMLVAVLEAPGYRERETALVAALEAIARSQNAAGVTEPLSTEVELFHGRPFRVLGSGRFVAACRARVSDPWLRSLPLTGAIDQFVDSTDVTGDAARARAIAALYDAWTSPP